MNDNKAEYGPSRKYCGEGNIQLIKKLSETVIESTIDENLPYLFAYMNKSYALKQNIKEFRNGSIAVINYDLHAANNRLGLTCPNLSAFHVPSLFILI